jgi:hypothetical protein
VDVDGPLLIAEDLATGLKYENGVVTTSEEPGLGIKTRLNPGSPSDFPR